MSRNIKNFFSLLKIFLFFGRIEAFFVDLSPQAAVVSYGCKTVQYVFEPFPYLNFMYSDSSGVTNSSA